MPRTTNTLDILIRAKGAEDSANKIQQVNLALDKTGKISVVSARGISSIGTAARQSSQDVGRLVDQFGRPVEFKGRQAFDGFARRVRDSSNQVNNLNTRLKETKRNLSSAKDEGLNFNQVFQNIPIIGQAANVAGAGLIIKASLQQLADVFAAPLRPIAALEDSINKFNTAMASIGKSSPQATREALAFADSLQQVTTFSDDAILTVQALVAQIGQVGGDTLQRATRAALDLAAAVNTDLRTAAVALGKAVGGNTDTLSEYGIVVGANIPRTERFAAAIEKVERTFGGAAQGTFSTLTGSLEQLRNEWNSLTKVFFAPIVPFLTRRIRGLKEAIQGLRGEVQGAPGDFGIAEGVTKEIDEIQAKLQTLARSRDFAAAVPGADTFIKDYDDLLSTLQSEELEVRVKMAINTSPLKDAQGIVERLRKSAALAEGETGAALARLVRFSERTLRSRIELDRSDFDATLGNIQNSVQREPTLTAQLRIVGTEKFEQFRSEWQEFIAPPEGWNLSIDDIILSMQPVEEFVDSMRELSDEEILIKFRSDIDRNLTDEELLETANRLSEQYGELVKLAKDYEEANHESADEFSQMVERAERLVGLMGRDLRAQGIANQFDVSNIFEGVDFPGTIFDELKPAEEIKVKLETIQQEVDKTFDGIKNAAQSGLSNVLATPFTSMLQQTQDLGQAMLASVKNLVAAIIGEFAKLAVLKIFSALTNPTGTIFDGASFLGTIFQRGKGTLDVPNPPPADPGVGQGALVPPPVLDFSRTVAASEFQRTRAGVLDVEPINTRKAIPYQQREVNNVEVTIHAIDAKSVERELRNGELGRAFANLGRKR